MLSSIQAVYSTTKQALPFLPGALRTTILHFTGLEELSQYHDYKSLLIMSVMRTFSNPGTIRSISETQRLAMINPPIKGRIWISTYRSPVPPEESVCDILLGLIKDLSPDPMGYEAMLQQSTPDGKLTLSIAAIEGEWTGYRAGVEDEEPQPDISEKAKFDAMSQECTSPTTVLYFHGGAYYLLDPATHRDATRKLARNTGGCVFSVRYRLAPQNSFPSALLDALVSYLTLLYPPPDAFHKAIPPEHIVFAGDSAGGNLALVLTKTLLELRQRKVQIPWYGEARDVPISAGVAVNSPWCDISMSFPDIKDFTEFDYLPSDFEAWNKAPECEAWNSKTAFSRSHVYCLDGLVDHPLTSPVLADGWEGAPPVFVCSGWEILSGSIKHFVQKIHKQGVKVIFEEYEGMPHCFAMRLPSPGAKRCYDGWTAFIQAAVEEPASLKSRAMEIKAKTVKESPLDFKALSPYNDDDVRSWAILRAKHNALGTPFS
ncbi:hypothetical protein Cpir12675_005790 [Ceratocystis pirilliformis]|uniref:Alpha/beta hydrolase fold-3 domain-containing protein n=1 Tax=Ceratocystis pirilliformis TaxID=259994 RepID=A0ABR3YNL1_9PEZI